MPPLLGRRRIIKVSLETNKGEAVAGATNVLCYQPQINPTDATIQREPSGAYGGPAKPERGAAIGTCTFRTELRANTTGQALDPGLLALFQACGMKMAGPLSPTTTIAAQKTVTIDVFEDGKQKRLYGAAGTWELTGEFGRQVFIAWTFTGLFLPMADAALPSVTQTAMSPMMLRNITCTIASYHPAFSRVSINPNNTVEARENAASASGEGVDYFFVAPNRRYEIGLDPESQLAATWNPYQLWLDRTTLAFSMVVSDGGTDVTFAAGSAQILAPTGGLRDSKAIDEIKLQCNTVNGDDELTITATAA